MSKILPKGHVSCLSNAFRYTPATHTNIANTFARIKRELSAKSEGRSEMQIDIAPRRPFAAGAVDAALRVLRAGGLRPMPRLLTSSDLSDA
jgi:hypothetical protein